MINRGTMVSHNAYEDYIQQRMIGYEDKVQLLEVPPIEVSASQIRDSIQQRKPFDDMVPLFVHHYLKDHFEERLEND